MKRIAFIGPDNELIRKGREVCTSLNLTEAVDFYKLDLNEALKLARTLDEDESCDAIISRYGIAHMLLLENLNTPVIEIMVTGQDLAQAFYEAKNKSALSHPKVVYLAFSNMSNDIERLSSIMGIELIVKELEGPEDIPRVIDSMNVRDTDILMGGATSMAYGAYKGFVTQVVESGECALREAFRSCLKVIHAKEFERKRTKGFITLINSLRESVIYISTEGHIAYLNERARELFSLGPNEGKNTPLSALFEKVGADGGELLSALTLCCNHKESYTDILINVRGRYITFNIDPVIFLNSVVNIIITAQEVTSILETEKKVRNELIRNKFYAKYHFKDIIGASSEISETKRLAREFSKVDATILITGESGTGKELFAQSIHNDSNRRNGPFVALNCAALPINILESELFGYVEGAFTGALRKGKAGLFEMAHHGTIFLDEISEMELSAQSRLLRVIQERQVMRLGDDKYIPVDVRIIAATNKPLSLQVKKGAFREDLYYRLKVLSFKVPPLRERQGDIKNLVRHFLAYYGARYKREKNFKKEAYALLEGYAWPGNIRELRGFVERMVIIARDREISESELLKYWDDRDEDVSNAPKEGTLPLSEKERITATIAECGGNISKAARMLGIDRSTLYRKIKHYALDL